MGIHSNMLNMNKWSKSLPSINNTKLNTNPSPDDDNESLTDVSIIIQTKSSSKNYKTSVEHKPIIQTTPSKYDQFVPDDQLFQSLIAYANSFKLDESAYSVRGSNKQRTQPRTSIVPSAIGNNKLIRHKSCENIIHNNKSTGAIQQDSIKLIPSHFFSTRKTESDNNDETTTITDGSKFEWEYLSDTIDQSNKPPKELFKTYQTTANIEKINLQTKFSQKLSPSPIIIREKAKDLFIQQNIDIQFFRPPTPIIVREILHKPSIQTIRKYQLPSAPKPPITPKRKIMYDPTPPKRHADEQSQQLIIEYDQINLTVDKNIKQRQDIQPYRYGTSSYSNKVFRNLLTNIIS
jgi:hypothetical protein